VRIDAFNAMPAAEASALLRTCADVDDWAGSLVADRPYPDLRSLVAAAAYLADEWNVDEVEQALSHHPRIGERSDVSAESAREQAGVDPADHDLAEALRTGNVDYEAKFGRIYLVRAKGRTGSELLALLRKRLGNDPETEYGVMVNELREIAVLRLEGLFA